MDPYLLFHSLAEIVSATISFGTFLFAWNTRRFQNGYLRTVGIAGLFTGLFEVLHCLAFPGMPVFPGYDENLSPQLWLAARLFQAGGSVAGLLLLRRGVTPGRLLAVAGALFGGLCPVVFLGYLPDAVLRPQGLTAFKMAAEWSLAGVFLVAVALMFRARAAFSPRVFRLLVANLAVMAACEVCVSLYLRHNDWMNFLGHLLLVVGGGLQYLAILRVGLIDPGDAHFREVTRAKARLELAQTAGRIGTFEWDLRPGGTIVTAGMEAVYGHPDARAASGYEDWRHRVHPDDIGRVEAHLADVLAGRAPYDTEYRVAWPDATIHWVAGRGRVERDEAGNPIRLVGINMEVTERKAAEGALRGSELRFRLALRHAPVSVAAQDRDLNYIWAYNQKTAPPGGVIGLRDEDIFTPEEAARLAAIKRRVLDEGIELHDQMWFSRPAGRLFLDVCWEPLRDEAGRVVGVTSATVDLTERKLADDAVRQSEEKFAKAFHGNSAAMSITRARDGLYLDVNDRWIEVTGFTRAEVVGHTAAELNVWKRPDDRARYVEVLRISGKIQNAECRLVRRNGEEWTALVSSQLTEVDGEVVNISSVSDITVRKRQERRVQELTRLYAVLSRVNEAIVRARDARVLYQDVCDIIATDGQRPLVWVGVVEGRRVVAAAAAGQALDYMRGLKVETDGEFGSGPSGTCIREGRPVVNDDFDRNPSTQPWRKAALEYNLRASASFPIRHQSAVVGSLTLYASEAGTFDAEQVRLLEALTADVSYALDKMSQERALQESERSLREADRRKDEFLAMLSHELRNPLAPIRSAIHILERAVPGGEQARKAQAIIDRQAGHLARLVDDLLDVTRITRGKIRLQREPLDLGELVRRVVEDHRASIAGQGLALATAIPDTPVRVSADRTRVAQIVGNLLHNAFKFTPPGGTVTVSVGAEPVEGRAVLSVRDTGSGITSEILPHLFEPFTQADRTLDRSHGGLGLGLSLVKGLAELHGGAAEAFSDGPGTGAEFVVRLPLDEAGNPPGPAEPVARRNRPRQVLVVEDNVDAAESLKTLLEFAGHTVRVTNNGRHALALALQAAPEFVLCDIGLPGMNGYEVARAFRADPALCGAVLIAISGYAAPDDVQRALEAGFARHLAKPASPETVEQVLEDSPADRSTS
jgi:PAS domain S-box-containing protein